MHAATIPHTAALGLNVARLVLSLGALMSRHLLWRNADVFTGSSPVPAAPLQVGRQEPVMVLRVDKDKGYIDLSKRCETCAARLPGVSTKNPSEGEPHPPTARTLSRCANTTRAVRRDIANAA